MTREAVAVLVEIIIIWALTGFLIGSGFGAAIQLNQRDGE